MSDDRAYETSDDGLKEAMSNFLAYASDQLPHLEREDLEAVAYVGRRLDQAWRWFDYTLTLWIEERYPQAGVDDPEQHAAVARAQDILKAGAPSNPRTQSLMGKLLAATAEIVSRDLSDAVDRGDSVDVAAAAYVARRWYTKYRVLKWRWLERHASQVPAYQWFEA